MTMSMAMTSLMGGMASIWKKVNRVSILQLAHTHEWRRCPPWWGWWGWRWWWWWWLWLHQCCWLMWLTRHKSNCFDYHGPYDDAPSDADDGDLLYLLDNDYCRILQWRCSHAEMILQKRENEATCLFSSLRVLAKPKNWTQQSTSFISVYMWHYSSLYVWYIYSRNAGQTKLKTHRWWHQCVCTRYVIACHKLEMSPKNRFNIFHCCISKTHKMSHLFNNSISTNSKT